MTDREKIARQALEQAEKHYEATMKQWQEEIMVARERVFKANEYLNAVILIQAREVADEIVAQYEKKEEPK